MVVERVSCSKVLAGSMTTLGHSDYSPQYHGKHDTSHNTLQQTVEDEELTIGHLTCDSLQQSGHTDVHDSSMPLY